MPKSILKKTTSLTPANTPSSPIISREDRIRDTALYHAKLLQQRKDADALNLSSTETLLGFPRFSYIDPRLSLALDAKDARSLLKSFQPSDYDLLIEERNINKKCGYVLCPRPNRQEDTNAKYRILRDKIKGTSSLKFVERQTMEHWCSDDCGKKALFIRVQLSDEPSWTRMEGVGNEVIFLDEEDDGHELSEGFEKLHFDIQGEDVNIVSALKDLSIVRGYAFSWRIPSGFAKIEIQENMGLNLPSEAGLDFNKSYSLPGSVEGHTPSFGNEKTIQMGTGYQELS